MSPNTGGNEYHSDSEWEAMWLAEHRRHRVDAGTGSHLVCSTCGSVLNVTTQSLPEALEKLGR